MDASEKRGKIVLLITISVLLFSLLAIPALSGISTGGIKAAFAPDSAVQANSSAEIYFFYDPSCGECQRVLAFLPGYLASRPNVGIRYYDISNNTESHDLFHQYNERYGRPSASVPAILARTGTLGIRRNHCRSR